MSAPLTVLCQLCEDGIVWTSRHGGNDPDTYRVGLCELCDGTCRVPLSCDCCPNPEATEWFQGLALCPTCAAEQKADALSMAEDV